MRNEQDVCMAIERYADTVQRLCMVHLKNRADTEDIFQTVFLKYALHSASFASEEHEKAWFIRVTLNACKDLSRSLFRRRTVPLEEIAELPAQLTPDNREVLEAVLSLPAISRILGKRVNTVYALLTRAKKMPKEKLGGAWYEGDR